MPQFDPGISQHRKFFLCVLLKAIFTASHRKRFFIEFFFFLINPHTPKLKVPLREKERAFYSNEKLGRRIVILKEKDIFVFLKKKSQILHTEGGFGQKTFNCSIFNKLSPHL